jgi:hypothetical protein
MLMKMREMAVIFPTYEDVDTVRKTLPSVIEECRRTESALIVHDASEKNRDEMWVFLKEICGGGQAFLILTSPMSMASARNMCLSTAFALFAPSYICMLEDDHGLRVGAISALLSAMREYYGKLSPNGLRFGLFSGCLHCWRDHHKFSTLPDGHVYPDLHNQTHALGGANSCFRCAPASHWQNVLQGYDQDEYMISNWQTRNINFRNYNRGFTSMYVNGGDISFSVDRIGQGYTQTPALRRWDEVYTASDPRSKYYGKVDR